MKGAQTRALLNARRLFAHPPTTNNGREGRIEAAGPQSQRRRRLQEEPRTLWRGRALLGLLPSLLLVQPGRPNLYLIRFSRRQRKKKRLQANNIAYGRQGRLFFGKLAVENRACRIQRAKYEHFYLDPRRPLRNWLRSRCEGYTDMAHRKR